MQLANNARGNLRLPGAPPHPKVGSDGAGPVSGGQWGGDGRGPNEAADRGSRSQTLGLNVSCCRASAI